MLLSKLRLASSGPSRRAYICFIAHFIVFYINSETVNCGLSSYINKCIYVDCSLSVWSVMSIRMWFIYIYICILIFLHQNVVYEKQSDVSEANIFISQARFVCVFFPRGVLDLVVFFWYWNDDGQTIVWENWTIKWNIYGGRYRDRAQLLNASRGGGTRIRGEYSWGYASWVNELAGWRWLSCLFFFRKITLKQNVKLYV